MNTSLAATPGIGAARGGSLAAQQQRLLAALWMRTGDDALAGLGSDIEDQPTRRRGLQVYRANGLALAERALEAAYPVVAALLGTGNFAALAQRHWREAPPACGDIARWGADLSACIEGWAALATEEPYLADVARLEWGLHRACVAADASPDAASFAALTELAPHAVALVLADGVSLHASAYPVVSMVQAHAGAGPAAGAHQEGSANHGHEEDTEAVVSLEEVARRLAAGRAEIGLVWREGLRPRVREVDAPEAAFIAALLAGRSLAAALDSAPGLAFDQWLAPAVRCGLVVGASRHLPETP